MQIPASPMSMPDMRSTLKVIPDVPVVSSPSSVVEETAATSENLPPSGTIDLNFAEESNLPQTESSQEKTPPAANIEDAQKLSTQPLQPLSMQQVNIKLSSPQVLTTPSSIEVFESNLSPAPDNISQISLSLSSVDTTLSSVPTEVNVPSTTPLPPSVVAVPGGTPPVPVETVYSDSIHVSSVPSGSPPIKHYIGESEASSPIDTTAVLTGHDVLPVSASPYTEPTITTLLASQFDSVTAPSDFGSTVKMELGLESKEKKMTVNYPLEPSPLPSITPPQDSRRSHIVSPSATEDISHDEQVC